MPFCPQSNEPVNITGFHILKVPAFKVSLYGGNLFWWIAAHKYQVVRIMLSFKTEQIQIPDILNKSKRLIFGRVEEKAPATLQ